jgi:hypothetical protein
MRRFLRKDWGDVSIWKVDMTGLRAAGYEGAMVM